MHSYSMDTQEVKKGRRHLLQDLLWGCRQDRKEAMTHLMTDTTAALLSLYLSVVGSEQLSGYRRSMMVPSLSCSEPCCCV